MKRFMVLSTMVFIFASFVSTGIAFAGCGGCQTESSEKGEVINALCPVMGGEVSKDTEYKTEYNGKTIGFCCPACIETFNSDPEKYMAEIEKKCIIKCPECGVEIDVIEECKKAGTEACFHKE